MGNYITEIDFGSLQDGEKVKKYTLENGDMRVGILSYGAAIHSIELFGKFGEKRDVVLGFDDIAGYENHDAYFGATVGRYANRIKNGRFTIGSKTYQLNLNNGKCHLHGGIKGFDKQVFEAEISEDKKSLALSYLSQDMEENFPGNVLLTVVYTLTEDNRLLIGYKAKSDQDTIINITNHSYFNLCGEGSILPHKLKLHANKFLEFDPEGNPTGTLLDTKNTPLDFSEWKSVGEAAESDFSQIRIVGGMDHAFDLENEDKNLKLAAELCDPEEKIFLRVSTDMPGMHVYSANYLCGKFAGKRRVQYQKNGAICFEPEYFPDATLYQEFPSPLLRRGEVYSHKIEYAFDVK